MRKAPACRRRKNGETALRMKRCVLPLVVLALLGLSACTTVPETGRRQLMLVSPSEEMSLGLTEFDKIKQDTPVSHDAALNTRIQRIGRRIATAVGRDMPNAQWEFVVFDDPKTVNAFALPGGKVGVYTGLIALSASDDEIAIVMGHEIAHVTSRHGGERMSQALAVAVVSAVVVAGTENSKNRDYWRLAYGVGATLGTLAYSREHESEADAIGLRFAAYAGYDPRAAVSFWKKMEAKTGGSAPLKWLSTHPPSADRIVNLQRLAPQYIPIYEANRGRFE